MTGDSIALLKLIEKNADQHLVRDLLAHAAERMMDLEVGAKIGAAKGERRQAAVWKSRIPMPSIAGPVAFGCARAILVS